jgi:hypothetical protein
MNAPMNAGAESIVDELLRSLEADRVTIQWPDGVRAYLAKYPELIPHVRPAVASARQEFGDAARLTLTINDDPEFDDPYLKLYVRLPQYDREADERLERIAVPLSEAIANLGGYFRVAADYRNPAR